MLTTFNTSPSYILHLDLNSCFATVEQQANPLLRGKPMCVAAYDNPGGCIIAPSIEAKKLGIKVGMRVRDGKAIYPNLCVLTPDPDKYRFINRQLLSLLYGYSADTFVRSIDEMVVDFTNSCYLKRGIKNIALEIKKRIKEEIGEWLTVSVGIGPNRFLAKLASSLRKPDGLIEINHLNIKDIFSRLKLEDIHGIKNQNVKRLNLVGIFTPWGFYQASIPTLKKAFGGITGYYWYLRIHGFEIDSVKFSRKSFGNSYALYKITNDNYELSRILCKLVDKMGERLRKAGFSAAGIHISCLFSDYSYWHHQHKLQREVYANRDLYQEALKVFLSRPSKMAVRILTVSCFHLQRNLYNQLSLLTDEEKKYKLVQATDQINNRWGEFMVTSGRMMGMENKIINRIAFGSISELEEIVFAEAIQRKQII